MCQKCVKNNRKGIILAGGNGTRLRPLTTATSKQLLPVYNKPMIYYSLSNLMLCGIREIAIITRPDQLDSYRKLLGDGSSLGLEIKYIVQHDPLGIAHSLVICDEFLDNRPCLLVLGDNFLYSSNLTKFLLQASSQHEGATIFAQSVQNPSQYGVVEFDNSNRVISIEEKPVKPKSNFAIPGYYFLDNQASQIADLLMPSQRNELEITDLLQVYLDRNALNVEKLGRGSAWFDMGTYSDLIEAGLFVRTLQERQGLLIGSPTEISQNHGWI